MNGQGAPIVTAPGESRFVLAYNGGPVDVEVLGVPFQIQFGEEPSA